MGFVLSLILSPCIDESFYKKSKRTSESYSLLLAVHGKQNKTRYNFSASDKCEKIAKVMSEKYNVKIVSLVNSDGSTLNLQRTLAEEELVLYEIIEGRSA